MEKAPNNILLIGNGFDLAHGLLTKYDHFLYLMQRRLHFRISYDNLVDGIPTPPTSPFHKYLEGRQNMSKENIEHLGEIVTHNVWAKYFTNCEAEIDGWIDFEREIMPVLELFDQLFTYPYQLNRHVSDAEIVFRNETINDRVASLLSKYMIVRRDQTGCTVNVKSEFCSKQYGLLKKKILDDLKKEFDEFIKAMEIYLLEFVHKRKDIITIDQIRNIGADYVISFNYTLTECNYGIDESHVHHIHGSIRTDLSTGDNNMVLGINEQPDQNLDFIYFVKYFQRIQKRTGTQYKDFISKKYEPASGVFYNEPYNLHIYEHSLDITDEDILKYAIGNIGPSDTLNEKPRKVYIYYYDQEDFEHKVINLIHLYNRSVVEEEMDNGFFTFIKTTSSSGKVT